jgi:hypothetical protein
MKLLRRGPLRKRVSNMNDVSRLLEMFTNLNREANLRVAFELAISEMSEQQRRHLAYNLYETLSWLENVYAECNIRK